VDQQDEKKKVETIKSETAMECNWIMLEFYVAFFLEATQ
jgi:hypothetical protein